MAEQPPDAADLASLPDFQKGIDYWSSVDATIDGVLGGFGTGSLPRVEQLSSRLFLLSLLPYLQRFPSPLLPPISPSLRQQLSSRRTVALDVGAGVGRVTSQTLLPLLDDIITVEPVGQFIDAARAQALVASSSNSGSRAKGKRESGLSAGGWRFLEDRRTTVLNPVEGKADEDEEMQGDSDEEPQYDKLGNNISTAKASASQGVSRDNKRVWLIRAPLNDLDPAYPIAGEQATSLGVIAGGKGELGGDERFGERMFGSDGRGGGGMIYDVLWCQWCLGHLTDPLLVAFLKRAQRAVRPPLGSDAAMDGSDAEDEEELGSWKDKGGVIVVKENVCEDKPDGSGQSILDEEDSSLTRSNKRWEEIFEQAGLRIVKDEVQHGLPKGLFMVKSWALR